MGTSLSCRWTKFFWIAEASTGKTKVQAACVEVDGVEAEVSEFTCMAVTHNENVCASISLSSGSQQLLKCSDVWIGDTGATQHSTFSAVGGMNKWECNVKTKGQMGTATSTSVLMDFKVQLCNIHGNCYGTALLHDVQVNSSFNYNLFSINLKDGFTLSGIESTIALILTSDKWSIVFNVKIHTDSSFLLAGYMKRVFQQEEVAAAVLQNSQVLSVNEAHHLFKHQNENQTREIAKAMGIVLT